MYGTRIRVFLLFIYSFIAIFGFFDLLTIDSLYPLKKLVLGVDSVEREYAQWVGNQDVQTDLPILVLAGHADSQGLDGAGTRGEAVSKHGAKPMSDEITDELFWNLLLRDEITMVGKINGLNINSYDPGVRNIAADNDPRTNWSVGAEHARQGGYAIEIHFDSYGRFGAGSGLIPPLFTSLNKVDESLGKSFGRFPLLFRGGLGAPRRNIRILEIAKLEGELETNLRDIETRDKTIRLLAIRVVDAMALGLGIYHVFNPTPCEKDIFLPAIYL